MNEFAFPWLTGAVVVPAAAALLALLWPQATRRISLAATLLALLLVTGASMQFYAAETPWLVDPWLWPWDIGWRLAGRALLGMDELSALLLPFCALLFAVVILVMPRTEIRPRSARRILVSEAILLLTFATGDADAISILWILSMVPAYFELRERAPGTRSPFLLYMLVSAVLVGAAVAVLHSPVGASATGLAFITGLWAAAIMIRKGIVPLHSWMLDFFEQAPLATSILYCTPQIGAYAAIRMVSPHAPRAVLAVLGIASLVTAVYGAGLALVQDKGRRAFGALFMGQSALVLVGLDSHDIVGLTGSLCLWISSGLAMAGFGMTIQALEARRGRLRLNMYHGGYERTPTLAASFLLLGLACVGFPGTLGFVGQEALVDGAVVASPQTGVGVMLAVALNGIFILRTYFSLFCGARMGPSPGQRLRMREYAGFLLIVAVLVLGGLIPQPFVASRHRAAEAVTHMHHP